MMSSTVSKNKRAKTGDGKATTGNHRADGKALRPKVVYLVRWKLDISIDEFSDCAFDDCYGEEYQDQMDAYREQEKNVSGTSDEAYNTIQKANAAAKKKFEALRDKYLFDTKCVEDVEESGVEKDDGGGEEDDDSAHTVFVYRDDNGGKSWSWEYEFHDEGNNCLSCTGSVGITNLLVIECDGKIFKECSLEVK